MQVCEPMQTFEAREFYTLAEVAAILRIDVQCLRRRIVKRGRIAYHQAHHGAMITIRHNDLVAYIESTRVQLTPEKDGKKS